MEKIKIDDILQDIVMTVKSFAANVYATKLEKGNRMDMLYFMYYCSEIFKLKLEFMKICKNI